MMDSILFPLSTQIQAVEMQILACAQLQKINEQSGAGLGHPLSCAFRDRCPAAPCLGAVAVLYFCQTQTNI